MKPHLSLLDLIVFILLLFSAAPVFAITKNDVEYSRQKDECFAITNNLRSVKMTQIRTGLPAVTQVQFDGNAYLEGIVEKMKLTNNSIVLTEQNDLLIRMQSDAISVVGVNGCQVDALIELTAGMLRHFNSKFPSRETSLAITKLEEALHWLEARTKDRENRGVEGTNTV